MKPFRVHAFIPEVKKRKLVESEKKPVRVKPRPEILSRAKSERKFLSEFRRRSSILVRLIKERAKEERNLNSHLEILERIEDVKTKNQFFSMKCGLKKEFTSTGRLLDKQQAHNSVGNISRKTSKYFLEPKKSPVPLSSFNFDPNIIPDCGKKPITFEELESYLKIKNRSLIRFS